MVRIIYGCSVLIVIGVAGCNTTNPFASNKTRKSPGNPPAETVSQDLFASKKLKDPIKIHLAYAAWHEQSGNLQESRKSYLKVLDKNSKNVDAILGLARIDQAYGLEDEAEAKLSKVLKLHPKNPQVMVAIGQLHASRNEWPEAIEKMKAAHELAPYDTIYEYQLAVVETRAGEISSALDHFTRSVGQAEAFFNVGFILNDQGRTVEAESYLMKALKLKPELKQAETALAAIRTNKARDVEPASFSQKSGR